MQGPILTGLLGHGEGGLCPKAMGPLRGFLQDSEMTDLYSK